MLREGLDPFPPEVSVVQSPMGLDADKEANLALDHQPDSNITAGPATARPLKCRLFVVADVMTQAITKFFGRLRN